MKTPLAALLGSSLLPAILLLCSAGPCHAAAPSSSAPASHSSPAAPSSPASPADAGRMMGGPLGPRVPGQSTPGGMGGFAGGLPGFATGGMTQGAPGGFDSVPCGGTTGSMGGFSGGTAKGGDVPHPEGLVEFHAEFISAGGMGRSIPGRGGLMLPLPPEYRHSGFRLSLRKADGGFTYEVTGLNYGPPAGKPELLASGPATEEDARELCDLLNSFDTARLDGWHRANTALGCDFSLSVRYAGGETIGASGRGGVSVLPPDCWHPRAYLGFFSRLAESQGKGFRSIRADAGSTGPLKGLVVRFVLAEPRNGMPAGSHDYQLFRTSKGPVYSLVYRRGKDDYTHITGAASQEDLDAAKAILGEQDCWNLAGVGHASGHFGGGESYGLIADFESGPGLESGGEGSSIPAAWHEEPWFAFFMKLAESHGEKDLRARLFHEGEGAPGK